MKLTSTISSLVLVFVYCMLTFVGVVIHYCSCTQSKQLVVLAMQNECPPCSSAAEDCCPHGDPNHNFENNCREDECCLITYQFTNVDQLRATQPNNEHAKVLSLFFLPFVSLITVSRERSALTKNHSPPPNLLKTSIIHLYRQLRL